MARAQATDFLQSFRFHVICGVPNGDNPIKFTGPSEPEGVGVEAGFQSVTLPEASVENAEYREGSYKYTRKFPGPMTFSDCTLMRGLTGADTVFWDWIQRVNNGGEYRQDLTIMHFSRQDLAKEDPVASRQYNLYECVPTRCKPAADFDATSSEVSLTEVDIAMEWFDIVIAGQAD